MATLKTIVEYKITVQAVVQSEELSHGEWGVVDHIASGEFTKDGNPMLKPKMGFLPEQRRTKRTDVKILEQVVSGPVDLVKLVQVVNGLL